MNGRDLKVKKKYYRRILFDDISDKHKILKKLEIELSVKDDDLFSNFTWMKGKYYVILSIILSNENLLNKTTAIKKAPFFIE